MVATVRLLEITNMLLQHKACFLKLFSLAIERDCKLLESYNGADSMDKSSTRQSSLARIRFFVELSCQVMIVAKDEATCLNRSAKFSVS